MLDVLVGDLRPGIGLLAGDLVEDGIDTSRRRKPQV